jgi:hypothetical protein
MTSTASFTELSDTSLIVEVKRLAADERRATAALIASLAEVDARRLYLGEGCASLFAYCTRVLHLSEHAAYTRIEGARTVRRFPMVLQRLADGELTLTAVTLLRPHLTDENCTELLDKARHATKRDVEQLVASIAARPDAPAIVRRLPEGASAARDGGRCAFEGREGRCSETGFLEFHHVVPFARRRGNRGERSATMSRP